MGVRPALEARSGGWGREVRTQSNPGCLRRISPMPSIRACTGIALCGRGKTPHRRNQQSRTTLLEQATLQQITYDRLQGRALRLPLRRIPEALDIYQSKLQGFCRSSMESTCSFSIRSLTGLSTTRLVTSRCPMPLDHPRAHGGCSGHARLLVGAIGPQPG